MTAASDDSPAGPTHLLVVGLLLPVTVGLLVLFVVALRSVLSSSLTFGMKIVWVILMFCMPVLAWFAWYLFGRPTPSAVDRTRPGAGERHAASIRQTERGEPGVR
jgi:hypothetical protein